MKMPFTFLDHTADIGIDIWDRSMEKLFETAALAVTDILIGNDIIEFVDSAAISLEAGEPELLLVEWLSEVVYLFETKGLLVGRSEVAIEHGDSAWRLRATVWGESLDPERHHVNVLLKAVTYHDLRLIESPDGWSARVIFDI